MGKIKILNPGFFTTVQDEGCNGYRNLGIAYSGAIDNFSYKISNFIVGNTEPLASLEIIIDGPDIKFYSEELICIGGGDLTPSINNKRIPLWTSIKVNPGDILSFKKNQNGMTCYLSFSGGISIKKILNSYSTNIKGRFGGFCGRNLKSNDILTISTNKMNIIKYAFNKLPNKYTPIYKNYEDIRVVLGPQDDYFSQEEILKFLNETYEVSNSIDRVGFRLKGKALSHKKDSNIISDGNNIGSIQIPGDGVPIILMNDCGTTGGYPKIASIISCDLNKISQLKPGNKIKFTKVSLKESHKLYVEYNEKLNNLKNILLKTKPMKNCYNVKIKEKKYIVSIEEIK